MQRASRRGILFTHFRISFQGSFAHSRLSFLFRAVSDEILAAWALRLRYDQIFSIAFKSGLRGGCSIIRIRLNSHKGRSRGKLSNFQLQKVPFQILQNSTVSPLLKTQIPALTKAYQFLVVAYQRG